MPDDVRPADVQLIKDSAHVFQDCRESVRFRHRRLVGIAEAAQIWSHDLESRLEESWNLVSPKTGGIWEAVQEEDRFAASFLNDVQVEVSHTHRVRCHERPRSIFGVGHWRPTPRMLARHNVSRNDSEPGRRVRYKEIVQACGLK